MFIGPFVSAPNESETFAEGIAVKRAIPASALSRFSRGNIRPRIGCKFGLAGATITGLHFSDVIILIPALGTCRGGQRLARSRGKALFSWAWVKAKGRGKEGSQKTHRLLTE